MVRRADSGVMLFCDRLDAPMARELLEWHRRARGRMQVRSLEPRPSSARAALLDAVLRAARVKVYDEPFFAGHLRTADGESVYVAARRITTELAFSAADRLIEGSPLLCSLNNDFGRGTVRLYLARRLWQDIEPIALRILVARALSLPGTARVFLHTPATFDPGLLASAFPDINLRFCRAPRGPLGRIRQLLRAAAGSAGRELKWIGRGVPRSAPVLPVSGPGLLLLQEDDLSADRSYRTQPHWLLPADPLQSFRVYVLPRNRGSRLPVQIDQLRKMNVHVLSEDEIRASRRPVASTSADRALAAAARASARGALTASRTADSIALMSVWGLLMRARSLAALCGRLDIRAYVSAESYPVESDAMQIVGSLLGIRTVAYQYSNLAFSTPLMMTTADRLMVFSRAYRPLWLAHGVAPGGFEEMGYVFDGAFSLVAARARQWRARLTAHRAAFIFCYFDESVQTDRFGLIGEEDHRAELRTLAERLLDDPTVGLIVKTQFERNSPSRRYADDPVFSRAAATGRYLELCHGKHRNTVFPAEAALASDFAIGHVVGATAALEAALAGTRATLLNPYGMRSFNDDLYARAHIVCGSMSELLSSADAFRGGDPRYADFGDWTRILPVLDPYRDGGAARRLRAAIDAAVAGAVVPAIETGAA